MPVQPAFKGLDPKAKSSPFLIHPDQCYRAFNVREGAKVTFMFANAEVVEVAVES